MHLRRYWLLGLVLGSLLLGSVSVTAQGGPFSAAIENFWNVIVAGNRAFTTLATAASGYHSFGTTLGANGYGFRDSAGTMQVKSSGGAWAAVGTGNAAATYLIQTADATLANAQVMGTLVTGLVYNTTTTGVQSIIVCGTAGTTIQGAAPPTCTATPTLGVNAATSGTLGLANGAGGGVTWTLASGATSAWTLTGKATAPAQGDLLTFSNATGQMASVADVAVNQVLTSGGVGAVPAYSASPTLSTITLTTTNILSGYQLNGVLAVSGTAPQLIGFGTSPSVVSSSGTAAFTINVGTGGTASTGTIDLPTAANGWVCNLQDVTTPASYITSQTGGTTTTATVTNYSRTTGLAIAWTASDILRVSCLAY